MANFTQRFEVIYKIYSERAVRDGQRATKAGLAKMLTASMGKLQKWEEGQVPKPDDLRLLHDLFGFSYEWLVTGEGDPLKELEQPGAQFDPKWEMSEMAEKIARLEAELAEARQELREERALNRKLTNRLLGDDAAGKDARSGIARAVGHE